MKKWLLTVGLGAILVAALPLGAMAQETPETVTMTTPYLGLSVESGNTATLNISLSGPTGTAVTVAAEAPDGWATRVRGGTFIVSRVMLSDEPTTVILEVDVPAEVTEGSYPVSLRAQWQGGSDQLDFELMVSTEVGGGVGLTSEFPELRGSSDTTFSFSVELANDTLEEVQFGLQATGPAGWVIAAQPAGESQASTVTVDAGASTTISVSADPPDSSTAGDYPILVQAAGSGNSAEIQLVATVTGSFDMVLTTPDQRLNADVTGGDVTEFPVVVVNTGTAPLEGVSLTATPPTGWTVEFVPDAPTRIEAGATLEATALITPSTEAITGDYQITLRASVPEVSSQIEIRTTVHTSRLWGAVGLGIIALAVVGLGVVFRMMGRR
jgi:uncharacterized repeat protein (TIGR01451 family)